MIQARRPPAPGMACLGLSIALLASVAAATAIPSQDSPAPDDPFFEVDIMTTNLNSQPIGQGGNNLWEIDLQIVNEEPILGKHAEKLALKAKPLEVDRGLTEDESGMCTGFRIHVYIGDTSLPSSAVITSIDADSPVLDFDTPFSQGGLLPPGLDAVVS